MRRSTFASLASPCSLVLSLLGISGALAQTRDVAGSRDYPASAASPAASLPATRSRISTRRGCRRPPSGTASRPTSAGPRAASRASPTAPARAPRSSKSRAISRPSSPRPASRRCSPATPTPAAAFRSRKRSTRCRSRRCGSTASTIATTPAARGGRTRNLCGRPGQQEQRRIYAQLVVAVVGAIENKMVDAGAMAKGLREKGHIALYGIYFDTDKAVIKPESRPTLDEIAKLLRAQPQLNVFIVGHTDSQGTFDYNVGLSRRRAEAVAAELPPTRSRRAPAHRGRRLPRAGRLQRHRRRPRAQPARGARGAVGGTRRGLAPRRRAIRSRAFTDLRNWHTASRTRASKGRHSVREGVSQGRAG